MSSLTPRQAAEELRRFIGTVESSLSSHNLQTKQHGQALTEVSSTLVRLRETLSYDRQRREFASEFVSKTYNGVEILLRALSMLQRLLHEASQQPSSKFSTLLNRNGASSNKRRKTGVAEADCLECIKLISLQMPSAAHVILEHVTYLEIILISITSPQLDSKCFALEIITQLLSFSDGFMALFKALTSVAGKNRDESRLALVVSQLKHGLNTSKLHIQILVTRFLNNLIAQSPNLNYRLIMQAESENAGFNADKLEKTVAQYGRQSDYDILKRELIVWKNAYLPLIWLQKKAQEITFGTQPNDYLRRNQGYPNGVVAQDESDYVGYRYDTDTISRSKSNNEEDSEASTFVTDRSSQRMYNASRSSKNNSPRAPVVKEVSRQKKKRFPPSNSSEPSTNRYATSNGSVIEDREPQILLETNPSYVPYPFNGNKVENNIHIPHQTKRTSSIPSSQFDKFDDKSRRSHNEGILKRPKSEQGLFSDGDNGFHRRTRREEEIFRQYEPDKSSRTISTNDFRSAELNDNDSIRQDAARRNFKSQSIDGLNSTAGSEREWSIPIKRVQTTAQRPEPEGRSVIREELLAGNQKLQRTLSNASEKAKMQGFSYLFPKTPVVEELPIRRAKTPTALQEEVYSRSGNSDVHYSDRRPPRMPQSQNRFSTSTNSKTTTSNPFQSDDVIYIPLRVEETGQVLTRPPKKGAKLPNGVTGQMSHQPVQRFAHTITDSPTKSGYTYETNKRFENKPVDNLQDPRRRKKSVKGSAYGDDVEDALKRFDYLNDYSVEEGSRSSRYAAN